jgi:hypothetical protein
VSTRSIRALAVLPDAAGRAREYGRDKGLLFIGDDWAEGHVRREAL